MCAACEFVARAHLNIKRRCGFLGLGCEFGMLTLRGLELVLERPDSLVMLADLLQGFLALLSQLPP